jgi:hypothetical protein
MKRRVEREKTYSNDERRTPVLDAQLVNVSIHVQESAFYRSSEGVAVPRGPEDTPVVRSCQQMTSASVVLCKKEVKGPG